jgi:hypothetical protein
MNANPRESTTSASFLLRALSVFEVCFFLTFFAFLSGCSSHTYVGLTPAENIRDVDIPSGVLAQVPNSANVAIVGMAYEESSDHIFLRLLPGTSMREIERKTGALIRNFTAACVTAGCGGFTPDEFPTTECGLAMRWSDRHFFLDHPTGNPVAEIDFMGNFVRNITLQTPHGPIGGLTYDQRSDHLFVLFINRLVAEVDLNGLEMRRFTPSGPYQLQPQGLSMNSARRELYIPLMGGNRIGVFDLNGSYKDSYPLQRSGATGGVAAGDRNFLR